MTTTSRLAHAVLQMPAMPLRVQLVGRLSEDLRAAIADATFAPADVAVLDASLHQVLNGWSLSVSRFFRVQDEVEAVLTRALVGRALVDRVLSTISANVRIAWMLRHVEGLELAEVASACGCSLATVKRRIAAAETAIRAHIGPSDDEIADAPQDTEDAPEPSPEGAR